MADTGIAANEAPVPELDGGGGNCTLGERAWQGPAPANPPPNSSDGGRLLGIRRLGSWSGSGIWLGVVFV